MTAYQNAVDRLIHNLAKPPGSLGLLERQARQILLAWEQFHKELQPCHIIFAADNGIVRAGVVAQLSDITYMQSQHMVAGTSAVTCFCRCNGIPYEVVDVGIDSEDAVGINRKIARGTEDFSIEPAMTQVQYEKALSIDRHKEIINYCFISVKLSKMRCSGTVQRSIMRETPCAMSAALI